ncbi:nucleoside deaminase [Waterburya agarophytonicola K14]|uniref:Nucleoside deaminase n=1 Tax=Waterburya agarophytonicola KI4 TaxID=2874699 RepID=A0A964BRB6_9CYAN|nr:nucleoside deaminase [Waterburya agarophytonicola KI4]
MNHQYFMKEALLEAQKGDLPYGAVIVKDNEVIIRGYNTTQTNNDVAAHGEINVLRQFTKKYGYSLETLKGYTLYTTCEPCPMCAAACVWAGVSQIVFGASTKQLIDLGTKQIDIPCKTVVEKGFQNIEVIGGILADECLELFRQL